MGITSKTRKVLWALSGNRCAICEARLVHSGEAEGTSTVVGEECHIVARSPDGPRGDPLVPDDELDSIANLLLLCAAHHKQIDDHPELWPAEKLRELKRQHESMQDVEARGPLAGAKFFDHAAEGAYFGGSAATGAVFRDQSAADARFEDRAAANAEFHDDSARSASASKGNSFVAKHWKCKLGLHNYEYHYIADDKCKQMGICSRCGAQTERTKHCGTVA